MDGCKIRCAHQYAQAQQVLQKGCTFHNKLCSQFLISMKCRNSRSLKHAICIPAENFIMKNVDCGLKFQRAAEEFFVDILTSVFRILNSSLLKFRKSEWTDRLTQQRSIGQRYHENFKVDTIGTKELWSATMKPFSYCYISYKNLCDEIESLRET